MADFTHMMNIIQGEVMRINERRPLEQRPALLDELIIFLSDQRQKVIIEKLKVTALLPEPDHPTGNESAEKEH